MTPRAYRPPRSLSPPGAPRRPPGQVLEPMEALALEFHEEQMQAGRSLARLHLNLRHGIPGTLLAHIHLFADAAAAGEEAVANELLPPIPPLL